MAALGWPPRYNLAHRMDLGRDYWATRARNRYSERRARRSPIGTSRKSLLPPAWSAFGPKSDSLTHLISWARDQTVNSRTRALHRKPPAESHLPPPSALCSSGSSTRSKFSALIGPTSL